MHRFNHLITNAASKRDDDTGALATEIQARHKFSRHSGERSRQFAIFAQKVAGRLRVSSAAAVYGH
jgi:hypothetical protein